MKLPTLPKRKKRWLLGLAAAFLLTAAVAPFVSADRFRPAIQRDLEALTGRKIELLGEVRFRLLPRPGFTIENPERGSAVIVGELPQVGVEPFAYVERMDVSASIAALLLGRVEITRVSLETASLNLARIPEGGWNLQSLLNRAFSGQPGQSRPLPEIAITDGRLNFKSGDTKSVFYLDATEMTLEADATDPGRFGIRIEGEPARTDRPTRAFGRLSGRGMLTMAAPGRESRLDFSLALDRTPIAELLALAAGRGTGLGGLVAARAQISGPLSNLEIKGRLQLDEFERLRWLLPGSSGKSLDYAGKLDLVNQKLEFSTPSREDLPVSATVRASGLTGQPQWAAVTVLRQVPLSSLASLMGELGAGLPAGWKAEGKITGAVGLSSHRAAEGQMDISEGAVSLPDMAPLEFEHAGVVVEGSKVRLLPSRFRLGEQSSFQLEGQIERGGVAGNRVQFRMLATAPSGRARTAPAGVALADLQRLWTLTGGGALPPPLDSPQGRMAGALAYAREGETPAQWSGQFRLQNTQHRVEGFAQPVELDSAAVQLRGEAMALRAVSGRAGPVRFSGEAAIDPLARPPVRLKIGIAETSLADLEASLRPTLDRRTGLLARFRGAPPAPEWLRARRVEAKWTIDSLRTGDSPVVGVEGELSWIGGQIVVRRFSGAIGTGSVKSSFTIGLLDRTPEYRGQVTVAGLAWQDGSVDAEAEFETSGTGGQTLSGLKMSGVFRARELAIGPSRDWQTLSGSFAYGGNAAARLQFSGLQATSAGEAYQGQGGAAGDGRVTIDLTGSPKQYRVTGRLQGLHLQLNQAVAR